MTSLRTASLGRLVREGLSALAGVVMLAAAGDAGAGVAYQDHTYHFRQPNGEVLKVTIEGNDYYAEQRTEDGSLLVYDPQRRGLCYARVNAAGDDLESTGVLASNMRLRAMGSRRERGLEAHHRARKAHERRLRLMGSGNTAAVYPDAGSGSGTLAAPAPTPSAVTGTVRGLTVLIQFPDVASALTKAQVESFLNDVPYSSFGNAQSVRGYYQSVSGNKLDYVNTATVYYTAAHPKSYYTDGTVSFPSRAQSLISEALNWLKNSQAFNFSTLTTDSGGRILGLNFMYAGEPDSAWSTGLWPHMGTLQTQFCSGSVCAGKYQITNLGNALSIGTFVHETGHLLFGWPDLYDYDGSSWGSVAAYDIMGYGGAGAQSKFRPTPPNGYFRWLVGWDTLTELNPAVNSTAPKGPLSHSSGSHSLYRYSNPANPGEAFYIESIYKTGQNTNQPGQGLAVYHVDPAGSNSDEWHPYVQMEHADGARDPEYNRNQGDARDLYDGITYTAFNDSAPNALSSRGTNAKWWNATNSGLSIHHIGAPAQTQNFSVGTGETSQAYLYDKQQGVLPWFSYGGGSITLTLTGPASPVDFDLKLEKWVNSAWVSVATSEGPTTSEALRYTAASGYYRITVLSYSGAGWYTLTTYK